MAALQPALSWDVLHHEHCVSGSDGLWRTVQIFVEYVMLHKVNDSPETAHELGELLHGRNMIVNLIPWNPIYSPGMKLEAPGAERVAEFQQIMREEHGIFCTVRQEMGQDISGEAALPLLHCLPSAFQCTGLVCCAAAAQSGMLAERGVCCVSIAFIRVKLHRQAMP